MSMTVSDQAVRLADELGRCQVDRDTYKRIAEKGHELHQDIMGALPIIEGVCAILTEEHPELSDMLYEGIERLQGKRPEPAAASKWEAA